MARIGRGILDVNDGVNINSDDHDYRDFSISQGKISMTLKMFV